MGNFSPDLRARAFIAVVQTANMKKMGLAEEQYKDPEYLAEFLTTLWNESGKDRTSAVAVCISKDGLYHAHMALYGNTTTLRKAASILFQSHVEPQLGGKKELTAYLLKEGAYAEKGEQILYVKDIGAIQDTQGQRKDLDVIEELLIKGRTPKEILDTNFRFYRYEKMILKAYIDQRIKNAPLKRNIYFEYHVGDSGSGKTHYYYQLCEEYGADNIYLFTDFDNSASAGLDEYMKIDAPPVLFIDEFKGYGISYGKFLVMLNGISRMQTHSRYANTYNLWEKVIVTSIYPPEELYEIMVPEEQRKRDSYTQLKRRISRIVFHYRENDEYKTYSLDGKDYVDYESLRQRAAVNDGSDPGSDDGFIPVGTTGNNSPRSEIPFHEKQEPYVQEELPCCRDEHSLEYKGLDV